MQIFLSVFREFKRQKANLFFCAVFPAVLVFILGTLLEQWNISDYEIPDIRVGYVAENKDFAFIQYMEALEGQGILTAERVADVSKETALPYGEFAAVIEYDAPGHQIILHQSPDKVINRALHIMLQGYVSMEKALTACYENGAMPDESFADNEEEYVIPKKLGVERSMIDYYAVAMLVMILFMGGGISGSVMFYEYRQGGLFNRVVTSPAKKIRVFLLMLLGNLPMAAIEIGTVMLCSTFLFGARYCRNFTENLILILYFFVVALMISAFGAVVGLIVKFNPTAIMMPLSWIMLFLGGSFSKEIFIDGISNRMPAWVIQQAAFDLTLFGNYDRVFWTGAWMILCFFLFLFLGAVLFCKRKEK